MDSKNVTPASASFALQPFSVAATPSSDSTFIEVSGELDLATAGILRAAIDSVAHDTKTVYLDLARVTFIDCAGWDPIGSATSTDGEIRSIVIVSASSQVKRLLSLLDGGALNVNIAPALIPADLDNG
jgi:anti-anti-sigma factor